MKRSAITAGGDLSFRFARLLERLLARDRDEGIHLRIDGFDSIQKGAYQLYR